MKRWLVLGCVASLAGCGQIAPLRPKPGQAMPPNPAAAPAATSDPEKLMAPSDQSRPKRNDELLQNSEKRAVDPFDLPPSR